MESESGAINNYAGTTDIRGTVGQVGTHRCLIYTACVKKSVYSFNVS